MLRKLVILGLVVVMSSTVSACGRRGKLIPPEDSTYPRTYPDPNLPQDKS